MPRKSPAEALKSFRATHAFADTVAPDGADQKNSYNLSARQTRYATERAKADCQYKEAAMRAGYSANVSTSRLNANPQMRALIKDMRQAAADAAGADIATIVREWARVGFSDIRDIVEIVGGSIRVRDSSEWPDDAARAVSEVREGRDGIVVKMHPKMQGLEALGKFLGLFVDRKRIDVGTAEGDPVHEITIRFVDSENSMPPMIQVGSNDDGDE